ncbi:MAG: hypothetical protein AAF840_09070 [Bacteroidota bacterium]
MPIDYGRYPPDWAERVKRIRIRDNYTCTRCPVGEWDEVKEPIPGAMIIPLRKVVLTTAHLDHDETNWEVSDDRLATMCPACHLAYDRQDNYYRQKYGQNYRQTIPELPFPKDEP